eukprot:18937-Heterococcus_DN1.PRE.1
MYHSDQQQQQQQLLLAVVAAVVHATELETNSYHHNNRQRQCMRTVIATALECNMLNNTVTTQHATALCSLVGAYALHSTTAAVPAATTAAAEVLSH